MNNLYPGSPYKRDRVEDSDGYGPPQKRMVLPTGGYGNSGAPGVRGSASYNNFPSASKTPPRAPAGQSDDVPNKVLLFTVYNPKYPITVEVMRTICTSTGANVDRIVIFRKNGVQAMVEFDSVEGAMSVKDNLNGADIYSGCCTLKIDWGKPTRLNVVRNDHDSWDYTQPNLEKETSPKGQALLPDPKIGGGASFGEGLQRRGPPQHQGEYGYDGYPGQQDAFDPYSRMPPGAPRFPPAHQMPRGQRPQGMLGETVDAKLQQVDMYGNEAYGPGGPRQRMPCRGPAPGMYGQQPPAPLAAGYDDGSGAMLQQGSVLMVYGLNNEKMNCQKIFNLFCLYGNVVRVKFLKSKDGVAMVQLGDNASCERAIKNINGSFVFGHKMLMGYSKQAFIQDVPNPVDLPDGTVSFMDFMGNRNNRFTTPEAAAKNRIQPASKVLYFFNAPPGIKEADLAKVFTDCQVKTPTKVKVFPSKTERSSTGLLEWDNKGECVEALVAANHTPIHNPNGKNPYILKFCFSDAPIKG